MKASLRMAALLALMVHLTGCSDLGDGTGGPGPAPSVSFSDDVRPILSSNCLACHGEDGSSGGLFLGTRAGLLAGGGSGAVVVPGEPDSSLLVFRLETDNAALRMPPGGSLSEAQISLIRDWISEGAQDN